MSTDATTRGTMPPEITEVRERILRWIARHVVYEGMRWPSTAEIASALSLLPKTVEYHIEALVAVGWLGRSPGRHKVGFGPPALTWLSQIDDEVGATYRGILALGDGPSSNT